MDLLFHDYSDLSRFFDTQTIHSTQLCIDLQFIYKYVNGSFDIQSDEIFQFLEHRCPMSLQNKLKEKM